MTVYYDPQQPVLRSIFYFRNTSFAKVLARYEFWVFMCVHIILVIFTSSELVDTSGVEVPWDSVTAVQFFMTFFLTFYNKHCFARYQKLYTLCMSIVDGALLFVHELTAAFIFEEVEPHRIVASKYTLATVYIFFMGLTGGELSRKEWMELVHKGLLTKMEMEVLAEYPGGKVHLPPTRPVGEAQQLSLITLIVTNWAMQAVDEGLQLDCFWQERSERIAHYHNRLRFFNQSMLRSCYEVAHMVALPIPYPYFHLTNLVLALNLMFAACVLALFRTFLTIVPFAAVVIIFMSLREVATQLADPFGQDEVDFPVAEFLNYTFDNAICLLELFNNMDAATIRMCIESSRHFSDQQLSEPFDKDVLYRPIKKGDWYQWDKTAIMQELDEAESALGRLRHIGKTHGEFSGFEELQQVRKMRETLRVEARISNEEMKKLESQIKLQAEKLGLDSQPIVGNERSTERMMQARTSNPTRDHSGTEPALAQVPEDTQAAAETPVPASSLSAAPASSGGIKLDEARAAAAQEPTNSEQVAARSVSPRRNRTREAPPAPNQEELKFDNFEEARANLRRMLDPKAAAADGGAGLSRRRGGRASRMGPGGGSRLEASAAAAAASPSPTPSDGGKRDDSSRDKFTDAKASLEQVMRRKEVSNRAMDGDGLRDPSRGGKK
eukprot:CAMPEP_0178409938 /NCGR_PEP_ID=MMETSP0689_2-20121128/20720_1 /TAXON_ID=160604 /ORGANISM="Amphidinium massartii, Strain CS-259" /LENGTH=665 /DNA_ID=CAMNT_0020031095 /DNA_START=48 /DNA_END=2046 /DNA_ORIENTATION=+